MGIIQRALFRNSQAILAFVKEKPTYARSNWKRSTNGCSAESISREYQCSIELNLVISRQFRPILTDFNNFCVCDFIIEPTHFKIQRSKLAYLGANRYEYLGFRHWYQWLVLTLGVLPIATSRHVRSANHVRCVYVLWLIDFFVFIIFSETFRQEII